MNFASIFGRLTRDPELRYTAQGKPVAGFTIAVNRYGDNNEADFFDCTAWDKQAENIANSCRKGHRLLVWGHLRQEKWTDQQQQQRTSIKLVASGFSFIEPAPQQQAPAVGPPQQQYQQGYNQPPWPPQQQQGYSGPPMPPQQQPPRQGYGGPPPAGGGPASGYPGQQQGAAGNQPPAAQQQNNQPPGYTVNWNDIPF